MLGRRLRALRDQAGMTAVQAAQHLDVTQPTITRIEKGRNAILVRNVKQLCQLYRVGAPLLDTLVRLARESDGLDWFAVYGDTVPDWFGVFAAFEADAAEILSYEAENVPGLLQVPSYIRGIITAGRSSVADQELDQLVEFRFARQRRLDEDRPTLKYVLNEAVVRRQVGGPEGMRAQLEHLIEMSRKPYVTLQVLPFEAGAHPGQAGSFVVLRLPDEPNPNFVYLEHDHGALYQERPADLERYGSVFAQLTEMALSPDDTRELLVSLVSGS
jgi:transcriptional regulator with XRE-family HTH domain